MKVNFWQILGAVLIVLGVVFVVVREMGDSEPPSGPTTTRSAK